jgi:hypothetical protein
MPQESSRSTGYDQKALAGATASDVRGIFFILDHDMVHEPVPQEAHDAPQKYPAASLMAFLHLFNLPHEETVLPALLFDLGETTLREDIFFIAKVEHRIVEEADNGGMHHLFVVLPLNFVAEVIEQIEKMLMLVIHTFHTDTEFFIPDKDCHDALPPIHC